MTIESAFAKLLVEQRAVSQFTQGDLALRAGIAASYVSLMERGKRSPTIETIFKIALAFELQPEDLVKRLRLYTNEQPATLVVGEREPCEPERVPNARTLLAINVLQRRKKMGLTQKELAELAGVQRATVGQVEHSVYNAPTDLIQKLAEALSVPVARLFEPACKG
ncbi:helix-turn-helix transcriptional regulator [Rhodoferax sp. AJA081-3]|uniref:helix-turn-helix domain-containing protein n=1 Tax=Rhodoferax sp. AJA081-3 TaxID=2752316 RepID=UPI001BB7FDF8|nr:helix-turn-helix transcriptional regulator [Rhodoferax sp. AJA081-3]QTN29944.1 helix-turn-helix transcriptional regulator [Rhodoferax sp. AJA081-3]